MMKKLNQMLATLMALLLLCGMAGCGETVAGPTGSTDSMQASGTADNPGNTDGPDNTKDPDHADEPGKTEELGNTGELEGTILVGEQNWVRPNPREEGVFSDKGFYYVDGRILSFLDTSSGATTALCMKAGCLHGDAPGRGYENCDGYGYVGYGDMICFWNGALYYYKTEPAGEFLYRCNAVGVEHSAVCQLGERYTKEQRAVTILEQAAVDGSLYYRGRASGFVRDPETGSGVFQREFDYIARVDLATGKETVLLEDRENIIQISAASSSGVLYTVQERVDKKSPDISGLYKKRLTLLKFWHRETGKIGTILQKAGTDIYQICDGKTYCETYTGDEWYMSESYQFTFDLITGAETKLGENISMIFWGGNYIQCRNGNAQDWYLYDVRTGEKLACDIPLPNLSWECGTERGCILQWSIEITVTGGTNTAYRMCYVPYASLADGLQKSDLMCYYTKKNGYQ